jgi:hypothetical protein
MSSGLPRKMPGAVTRPAVLLAFDKPKWGFVLSIMKLSGMAGGSSAERSAAAVPCLSALAAILVLAAVIGLAGCYKMSVTTEADVRPVRIHCWSSRQASGKRRQALVPRPGVDVIVSVPA